MKPKCKEDVKEEENNARKTDEHNNNEYKR